MNLISFFKNLLELEFYWMELRKVWLKLLIVIVIIRCLEMIDILGLVKIG